MECGMINIRIHSLAVNHFLARTSNWVKGLVGVLRSFQLVKQDGVFGQKKVRYTAALCKPSCPAHYNETNNKNTLYREKQDLAIEWNNYRRVWKNVLQQISMLLKNVFLMMTFDYGSLRRSRRLMSTQVKWVI